ncbi:MAG: ERAP1-like C-terminal domain-containing protein, partial [Rhizobiales bacterium]|nr:ERAP1-like C-terminal domain-containing protein [Hyphomicrobiales bacterium]
QSYARARLRPVLDRLGWEGSGSADDDDSLLRATLIRVLGAFGDAEVVAEAKRRFASFLQDPESAPSDLRDAIAHVVGLSADRATYQVLLTLARKATATSERLRYYFAAAAARDASLARDTLAMTLTDELPITMVAGIINQVALFGEQRDLAWEFVQKNFDVLLAKQGPSFGDQFVPNFLTNFSDEAHAAELRRFAPAQQTSGGRLMTARAMETIAISAGFKERAMPLIEIWIRRGEGRNDRPD